MGGAILSCSTTPDDPLRSLKTSPQTPEADPDMAAQAGVDLPSLERGREIFLRKCLDCHEPRVPTNPDHPDWHPVLAGMSWNAELSAQEQKDMAAYLKAAAEQ